MARSTSLSDEAFSALREEKRSGESDSDVVLRLRREARARRLAPARFFAKPARFALTPVEHDELVARMRDGDRARDPWT